MCHGQDLTALCESRGFHLLKWMSNNRGVLAYIPETEKAKEVKDLDLSDDALPGERVLPVNWCPESNVFKIRINARHMPQTRRGILSYVSAIRSFGIFVTCHPTSQNDPAEAIGQESVRG